MPKNYLIIYSEQLATDIALLCQSIKAPSNSIFQIQKSSSSVYANIREANYGQSKADMLSKFEIALKECSETEGWLQLLFNTNAIDEDTYKKHRNLCGRIRRMLISSCKTLKKDLIFEIYVYTYMKNNSPKMIVRITKTEFEMENGVIYQIPFELDENVTIEEFQKIYDEWFRLFQQKGLMSNG